eukprot:snap_masked-scaffold_32-processed-gene-3.3-mRNA-1 protein AED:1.00 eAED:1.00 QI:0/0/0/0/1/1/2/0/1542
MESFLSYIQPKKWVVEFVLQKFLGRFVRGSILLEQVDSDISKKKFGLQEIDFEEGRINKYFESKKLLNQLCFKSISAGSVYVQFGEVYTEVKVDLLRIAVKVKPIASETCASDILQTLEQDLNSSSESADIISRTLEELKEFIRSISNKYIFIINSIKVEIDLSSINNIAEKKIYLKISSIFSTGDTEITVKGIQTKISSGEELNISEIQVQYNKQNKTSKITLNSLEVKKVVYLYFVLSELFKVFGKNIGGTNSEVGEVETVYFESEEYQQTETKEVLRALSDFRMEILGDIKDSNTNNSGWDISVVINNSVFDVDQGIKCTVDEISLSLLFETAKFSSKILKEMRVAMKKLNIIEQETGALVFTETEDKLFLAKYVKKDGDTDQSVLDIKMPTSQLIISEKVANSLEEIYNTQLMTLLKSQTQESPENRKGSISLKLRLKEINFCIAYSGYFCTGKCELVKVQDSLYSFSQCRLSLCTGNKLIEELTSTSTLLDVRVTLNSNRPQFSVKTMETTVINSHFESLQENFSKQEISGKCEDDQKKTSYKATDFLFNFKKFSLNLKSTKTVLEGVSLASSAEVDHILYSFSFQSLDFSRKNHFCFSIKQENEINKDLFQLKKFIEKEPLRIYLLSDSVRLILSEACLNSNTWKKIPKMVALNRKNAVTFEDFEVNLDIQLNEVDIISETAEKATISKLELTGTPSDSLSFSTAKFESKDILILNTVLELSFEGEELEYVNLSVEDAEFRLRKNHLDILSKVKVKEKKPKKPNRKERPKKDLLKNIKEDFFLSNQVEAAKVDSNVLAYLSFEETSTPLFHDLRFYCEENDIMLLELFLTEEQHDISSIILNSFIVVEVSSELHTVGANISKETKIWKSLHDKSNIVCQLQSEEGQAFNVTYLEPFVSILLDPTMPAVETIEFALSNWNQAQINYFSASENASNVVYDFSAFRASKNKVTLLSGPKIYSQAENIKNRGFSTLILPSFRFDHSFSLLGFLFSSIVLQGGDSSFVLLTDQVPSPNEVELLEKHLKCFLEVCLEERVKIEVEKETEVGVIPGTAKAIYKPMKKGVKKLTKKVKKYLDESDKNISGLEEEPVEVFQSAAWYEEDSFLDLASFAEGSDGEEEPELSFSAEDESFSEEPALCIENKENLDLFIEEVEKEVEKANFELLKQEDAVRLAADNIDTTTEQTAFWFDKAKLISSPTANETHENIHPMLRLILLELGIDSTKFQKSNFLPRIQIKLTRVKAAYEVFSIELLDLSAAIISGPEKKDFGIYFALQRFIMTHTGLGETTSLVQPLDTGGIMYQNIPHIQLWAFSDKEDIDAKLFILPTEIKANFLIFRDFDSLLDRVRSAIPKSQSESQKANLYFSTFVVEASNLLVSYEPFTEEFQPRLEIENLHTWMVLEELNLLIPRLVLREVSSFEELTFLLQKIYRAEILKREIYSVAKNFLLSNTPLPNTEIRLPLSKPVKRSMRRASRTVKSKLRKHNKKLKQQIKKLSNQNLISQALDFDIPVTEIYESGRTKVSSLTFKLQTRLKQKLDVL